MPVDKAAYLAAHYLTADTKPSKKRKRKHASKNDGLLIADDDDDWGTGSSKHGRGGNHEEGDGPAIIAGTSTEFRKSKKSNWKTIGAPVPADTKDKRDAAEEAADAVLAAVAAETAAAQDEDDAAPVVAAEDGDVDMLADGTHAGLQTAAAVTAQQEKRRKRERAELAQLEAERKAAGEQDEEVVLRDATGRRIDVSMRRAEARRAALEAEKAEEAKARLLKGDTQVEQARQRREALEDAALMPLARRADDTELNQDLKAQERWNDPMAQFLTQDTAGPGGKRKKGVKGRRPVYKGAAPPNRYGIKPGYRWDGVDRGTGFEAERFKAINRRERNKALDYSWQQDV